VVRFARADDQPEGYREILSKRAAPKLEDLSERAAPELQGEAATESFWDLLKLREEPVPAAVPELAKVLSAHEGSNRIHRFAAAQALHAVNTDDARRVLEKHLLDPEYPADHAIAYAWHWEMSEPHRTRFIKAYLLRDLSDDLAVSVHPRWVELASGSDVAADQAANRQRLLVTVKLRNDSRRTLALLVPQQSQAMILYLLAPSGEFVPHVRLGVHRPEPPSWHRLHPGEETDFEIELHLTSDAESINRLRGASREIRAALGSGVTAFGLRESGEYELSAMLVQTPLSAGQLAALQTREGI
jgi:hypothetical protein